MVRTGGFVLGGIFLAFSTFGALSATVADVITVENIARFSPRARADVVDSIVKHKDYLAQAGITSPRRFYHFMATIATETGGMTVLEENLNYSAERLLQVFPSRVRTRELAMTLAHRPRAIANFLYGGRLGNFGPNTDDGWNFRGSGLIQLTGRANFVKVGIDKFVKNPDLVRKPEGGFEAATAYWTFRNVNETADNFSVRDVRKVINGGYIGLDQAKLWYAKATKVFGPLLEESLEAPGLIKLAEADGEAAKRDILMESGFLEASTLEAPQVEARDVVEYALKEYQRANGLDESGAVDEDTFYTLVDPGSIVLEEILEP